MIESKAERKARKAREKSTKENLKLRSQLSSDTKVTVLCVKFGTKYDKIYVEKLRNMIARHLTVPYEFVCLTDDRHLIEGVRSIIKPNQNYAKGWWHKVHMFDPSLPLQGRILYFDLDVVIHDNLDKFVTTFTDDFIGILDFNRAFYSTWKNLNSSVLSWNYGSQSHIYEKFIENPVNAMRLPGDQDWIWKTSRDIIKFWPREWVQSYKWEVRKREELQVVNGKRKFKFDDHGTRPVAGCSVCVFHGDPNPEAVKDKFVVDNWR